MLLQNKHAHGRLPPGRSCFARGPKLSVGRWQEHHRTRVPQAMKKGGGSNAHV